MSHVLSCPATVVPAAAATRPTLTNTASARPRASGRASSSSSDDNRIGTGAPTVPPTPMASTSSHRMPWDGNTTTATQAPAEQRNAELLTLGHGPAAASEDDRPNDIADGPERDAGDDHEPGTRYSASSGRSVVIPGRGAPCSARSGRRAGTAKAKIAAAITVMTAATSNAVRRCRSR